MVLQYPFTEGLKPKLSYEQLMNVILDGGVVKPIKGTTLYDSAFFNNTFEMSKFRMMNLLDLEKLEENMRKQEMMRNEAKDISRETGIPAHVINNEMRNEERKTKVINFDLHDGDIFNDAYEDAKDEAMEIEKEEEEKRAEKVRKTKSKISSSLSKAIPKTIGQQLARAGRNKTIREKFKEVVMEEPDYIDPMVVNDEETQQKRGYQSDNENPKKKNKQERQLINQIYSERKKELRAMKLEEQADIKRQNRKERNNAMKEIVKEREQNYVAIPTKSIKVKKTSKKTKQINKKLALEDEDEKKKFEEGWKKTGDEIKELYAKKEKLDEARRAREEKKKEKMLNMLVQPEIVKEKATSSKDNPKYEQPHNYEHETPIVKNSSISFWNGKLKGFIKEQAELRGVRFENEQIKGGFKENHRGVKTKIEKFKKQDYLNALWNVMLKNKEISTEDYKKYIESTKSNK